MEQEDILHTFPIKLAVLNIFTCVVYQYQKQRHWHSLHLEVKHQFYKRVQEELCEDVGHCLPK